MILFPTRRKMEAILASTECKVQLGLLKMLCCHTCVTHISRNSRISTTFLMLDNDGLQMKIITSKIVWQKETIAAKHFDFD